MKESEKCQRPRQLPHNCSEDPAELWHSPACQPSETATSTMNPTCHTLSPEQARRSLSGPRSAGDTTVPQAGKNHKNRTVAFSLLLANLILGKGIFQLKHMNRHAKIQICKQGLLLKLMNICFLNSKVHKNIFMHFTTN